MRDGTASFLFLWTNNEDLKANEINESGLFYYDYYQINLTYIDFSFDLYDSAAFNANARFGIVNLTANTLIFTKIRDDTNRYCENSLTKNAFFVLTNIRSIQRYDRSNYTNYINYQIT